MFNSIVTVRFNEGPIKGNGRRVIFVSGDHEEPKTFVKVSSTSSDSWQSISAVSSPEAVCNRLAVRSPASIYTSRTEPYLLEVERDHVARSLFIDQPLQLGEVLTFEATAEHKPHVVGVD